MGMERERHGFGAQNVLSGVFALVVAGIVIVLVIFVARRTAELQEVCAGGVNGTDISEVCGGEDE